MVCADCGTSLPEPGFSEASIPRLVGRVFCRQCHADVNRYRWDYAGRAMQAISHASGIFTVAHDPAAVAEAAVCMADALINRLMVGADDGR